MAFNQNPQVWSFLNTRNKPKNTARHSYGGGQHNGRPKADDHTLCGMDVVFFFFKEYIYMIYNVYIYIM